jgi:hypothetical protein
MEDLPSLAAQGYTPPTSSDYFGGPWRPQSDEQIASMPSETLKNYLRAAARQVFGDSVQFALDGFSPLRDDKGRVIETGIGSPNNLTPAARAANKKAEEREAALKVKAGLSE